MIPAYIQQRLISCYPKGTSVSPSGIVAGYMRDIAGAFSDLFPHVTDYDLSEAMFHRKSTKGMTLDDWKIKVVITRTLEKSAEALEEYGQYDDDIVKKIFQQNISDIEYQEQISSDPRYAIASERVQELSHLLYDCRHG